MVIAALIVRAVIMWDGGLLAEAMDLSAEAARLAADQQPGARQWHPHLFLASRLVDLRRFEEARSVMRAAAEHATPRGLPGWSATPATLRARMSLAAGRLDVPTPRPSPTSASPAPSGPACTVRGRPPFWPPLPCAVAT